MSEAKEKIKVLFLCTGNACRSQIAEGWARHLKSDCIEAFSAGIRPIGVSSRAAKVMAEAGVDISSQWSKHIDEFAGVDVDYVITVCDYARESCPVFPFKAKHIHKPFEDPYFASGTDEQVMSVFRKVRDQIKAFVEEIPESLEKLSEKT
jgi:arsenate reductase